jgi:hypothetical protein
VKLIAAVAGFLKLVNGLIDIFQRQRDRQAGSDAQRVAQAEADDTSRRTADAARADVAADPALRDKLRERYRRD